MKIVVSIFTALLVYQTNYGQNVAPSSLNGNWKSLGYGYVASIDESKIHLYDICNIACSPKESISHEEFLKNFTIDKISDSTFRVKEGISEYDFVRIEKLPRLCQQPNSAKQNDPLHNFDVLWTTFDEHFAYFKERKIDWEALRTKYRSQITKDTGPFELFLLMDDLLEELNDGHSVMFLPDELAKKYHKHQKKLQKERIKKLGYKPKPINIDKTNLLVAKNYIPHVKSYLYGNVNWGKINDDLAMVQINGMGQLANYNIPGNYSENKARKFYSKMAAASGNYMQDEINGTRFIMDSVLKDISTTKACIVDVRFNGGGYDAVVMEILKSFAQIKGLAFSKKARMGNSFTRVLPIETGPIESAYKGKVYLLAGPLSASAAEGFAMGMKALCPNLVIVGAATRGIFSDRTEKILPNGWEFGLSNEIYFDKAGKNYEGIGILPDYKIDYKKKGILVLPSNKNVHRKRRKR